MVSKIFTRGILFLALLASIVVPAGSVMASHAPASLPLSEVTAFDLIVAMNTLRVSYGLPALVEDPIIDAVAQSTAQTMAANHLSSHIGNVSGRLAAAGYGGGAKVWGTENIALGYFSIDEIMNVWADAAHMLPVTIPAYCNMGAGVAKSSDGMNYYVFQAAYTSAKACGDYKSVGGKTTNPQGSTNNGRAGGVSQLIVPVKIASPGADGKVIHVVQAGQSLWSIAIAYKITTKELAAWNNLSSESNLQIGQKLKIPGADDKNLVTPTPVGIVKTSLPGADGKIVHVVEPYQTLSSISTAYSVNMDSILALNRIQVDWPLQIGQSLVIKPSNITPSPTPRPLTPIEKLTPASDGKLYHTVRSGENLAWIADLYKVSLKDLMSWNNLKETSVLMPNQKLLLQVTLPATITPTPKPATQTQTATPLTPTNTPTLSPTQTIIPATITATAASNDPFAGMPSTTWIILAGFVVGGLLILFAVFTRKK